MRTPYWCQMKHDGAVLLLKVHQGWTGEALSVSLRETVQSIRRLKIQEEEQLEGERSGLAIAKLD